MFKFFSERKTQGLFETIRNGDLSSVQQFLQKNGPVDQQDKDGRSALMVAAEYNRAEILDALLAAKAGMNLKNGNDRTALMLAAAAGHTEVCKHLIRAGCDTKLTDQNGMTAFAIANAKGQPDLVKDVLCFIKPDLRHLIEDGPEDPAAKEAFHWLKKNEGISVTANYKTSKEKFLADSAAWVITPPVLQLLMTDRGDEYILEYRISIWEFSPGNFKIPTGTVSECESDEKKMTLTAYYREAGGLKSVRSKEESNLWKSYTFSKMG
jgi:hypothetical protein